MIHVVFVSVSRSNQTAASPVFGFRNFPLAENRSCSLHGSGFSRDFSPTSTAIVAVKRVLSHRPKSGPGRAFLCVTMDFAQKFSVLHFWGKCL